MSHSHDCEGCGTELANCWQCPFCEKSYCIDTEDGGKECYYEHIKHCDDNPEKDGE